MLEQEFHKLLAAARERTGLELPPVLVAYVTALMISRINRVDLIPDPSFAEQWLKLQQSWHSALVKDYADSALFFCSLMPEYGDRRGLNMSYYAELGRCAYHSLWARSANQCYQLLDQGFYVTQQLLNHTIRHSDHNWH